jgi:hypothetical protein
MALLSKSNEFQHMGAAVVIVGALFECPLNWFITGNLMLTIGLLVEAGILRFQLLKMLIRV